MHTRVRSSIRFLGRAALIALTVSTTVALQAAARQESLTIAGSVVDSRSGNPLGGAVVHIRGTDIAAVTDASGQFRLSGVAAGAYTLSVSRTGFGPRNFRFEAQPEQATDGAVNVGSIGLQVSTNALVTVTGVVRDATTAKPVPQVPIELNGRVVAITDADGSFRIVTGTVDQGETNTLAVRRIGYLPAEREFTLPRAENSVDFLISMEPAPVRLSDIGVESDAVALTTGRMTGFYRRRATGFGHFFTRDQIKAIGAQKVTDVVRRVPGTVIFSEDNVNVDPLNPGTGIMALIPVSIVFGRTGYARAGEPCTPLIFINDMLINTTDFDFLLPANQIAGMEVYTSAAQIPVEYNRRGSACGVIVVWTDAPEGDPGKLSELELGGHLSARVSRGAYESERTGVQLSIPLFGALEFHAQFSLIFGRADGFNNAGWQAMGNFKARPLGRASPWYVGAGASFSRVRVAFGDLDNLGRPIENIAADVLLAGASIPLGPIRPFVEYQVLDLLTTGRMEGYLVAGFSVRSGNRERRIPGLRSGR